LKLNGAHQLLVYGDDCNIMSGSLRTIEKHRSLVVASKDIGLDEIADKTKYMPCPENKMQDEDPT
jgi:hypothetical protein